MNEINKKKSQIWVGNSIILTVILEMEKRDYILYCNPCIKCILADLYTKIKIGGEYYSKYGKELKVIQLIV